MPREVPIEPKRVMSVFRERVEKHKDELAELQEQEKLIEKEKPVSFFFINKDSFKKYSCPKFSAVFVKSYFLY